MPRRTVVVGLSVLLVSLPVASPQGSTAPPPAVAGEVASSPALVPSSGWSPGPAFSFFPAPAAVLAARSGFGVVAASRSSRTLESVQVGRPVAQRVSRKVRPVRRAAAPARRPVRESGEVRARAAGSSRVSRAATRSTAPVRGLSAVAAYARAQVGDSYRHGASGPDVFDCSGLVMRAYEQVGVRMPHQSGAQAARARTIPRSQARPGDLVVGPGHVGIYMGGGMMVDAGNTRVGVAYRPMYGGLYVKRVS